MARVVSWRDYVRPNRSENADYASPVILFSPLIQYNTVMPNLTLQINPSQIVLGPLHEQQLCYLLLTISAWDSGASRPVNWALIADASRSMRIPIVDEAQFRALLRQNAAQEMLVDGVPVWQLSGPVP